MFKNKQKHDKLVLDTDTGGCSIGTKSLGKY